MPVLKVYHHGITAGVPPKVNDHLRGKRGVVGGWSSASTRSNTRFLYSVDEKGLTGAGFALSLSVRDCPPTHDHWQRIRLAFFHRLRRLGLLRAHWLTEWQRRGVPHLHAAVWLPEPLIATPCLAKYGRATLPTTMEHYKLYADILAAWLSVAPSAGPKGQDVKPISDAVGWFKYLAKHASRGVRHYQRSPENIPAGWTRTGRMWGYLGAWCRHEAMRLELSQRAYWKFRRIVRAYRLADARLSAGNGRAMRVVSARRMLSCSDEKLSAVRGVSEWIPLDLQLRMVAHLAAQGHEVEQVWADERSR